jgi:hypothetical protein
LHDKTWAPGYGPTGFSAEVTPGILESLHEEISIHRSHAAIRGRIAPFKWITECEFSTVFGQTPQVRVEFVLITQIIESQGEAVKT